MICLGSVLDSCHGGGGSGRDRRVRMQQTWTRLLATNALFLVLAAFAPWVSASDDEPTIATPMPTRWMPGTHNPCRKAGKKWRMCDGPRRTPEPFGAAAYVAEDLGLGTMQAAQQLLTRAPDETWVGAVEGEQRATMLWPVQGGSFGRGYGYTRVRRRSLRHEGVDVGAAIGEPTRAVNDGIVAYADNGVRGYGNMVMLVHKDSSVTFYCHHRANYVFAGQQVLRGQVVGEVGMTGITRGPHLHFEYRVGGRARDPMHRMVGRPTGHDPVADATLRL